MDDLLREFLTETSESLDTVDNQLVRFEQEMRAGALGLSSGLEYDPGLYSTVDEVIACAKVDTAHNGLYISSAAQLTPGSILAL
ncbi:MAG TPA: hypothetical protein VNJ49_00090 [Bradyrhizobium sp.]|nr:hypothetical protein [Bradyrhizobium sp.]